jgi:hypothetical protein
MHRRLLDVSEPLARTPDNVAQANLPQPSIDAQNRRPPGKLANSETGTIIDKSGVEETILAGSTLDTIARADQMKS